MNQKQIWNSIAPEWNEFKTKPAQHVIEFLKSQKGNILDLGSGSGRHLAKIKNGKMFLVDFSEKMIELAKKKTKEMSDVQRASDVRQFSDSVREGGGGWRQGFSNSRANSQKIPAEFYVAELSKLPFQENFFDAAICISALHCIEKKQNND